MDFNTFLKVKLSRSEEICMIFEKIKEIVVDQLGVNDEDVKLETNFVEDLDADSLDLFQVIMEIEDAFNVKVEDVENIKTVADAVSFIESATAAK